MKELWTDQNRLPKSAQKSDSENGPYSNIHYGFHNGKCDKVIWHGKVRYAYRMLQW